MVLMQVRDNPLFSIEGRTMSEALHAQSQLQMPQSKSSPRSGTSSSGQASQTGPAQDLPNESVSNVEAQSALEMLDTTAEKGLIQPATQSADEGPVGDSPPRVAKSAAGQQDLDPDDDDVCRMSSVRDTPASSVATVRPARPAHHSRTRSTAAHRLEMQPPGNQLLRTSEVGEGSSAGMSERPLYKHEGSRRSAHQPKRVDTAGQEDIPAAGTSSSSPPLPKPRYNKHLHDLVHGGVHTSP